MKLTGDFQIIVLRARPAAQSLEIEPNQSPCTAPGLDEARLDVQTRILVGAFGQSFESAGHGSIGLFAPGAMIKVGRLEGPVAIVYAMVDVDHFKPFVEQINRG